MIDEISQSMQVYYLGQPSPHFLTDDWPEGLPRPLDQTPLFEVDALFVFANGMMTLEERNQCMMIERSGRPVVRVGAVSLPLPSKGASNILMVARFDPADTFSFTSWIHNRPRTNYLAIDCNFYDRFEEAIVMSKQVSLTYLTADSSTITNEVRLKATKTYRSEEYLQLENDCWLRMDRVVSLNGHRLGESCAF